MIVGSTALALDGVVRVVRWSCGRVVISAFSVLVRYRVGSVAFQGSTQTVNRTRKGCDISATRYARRDGHRSVASFRSCPRLQAVFVNSARSRCLHSGGFFLHITGLPWVAQLLIRPGKRAGRLRVPGAWVDNFLERHRVIIYRSAPSCVAVAGLPLLFPSIRFQSEQPAQSKFESIATFLDLRKDQNHRRQQPFM